MSILYNAAELVFVVRYKNVKKISETLERSVVVWSFVPLLLALFLTGSGDLQAQESGTPESRAEENTTQSNGARDKLFQIEDWSGYNLVTLLQDGTSLFSYVTETSSLPVEIEGQPSKRAEFNVLFRITFLARFQCSPLIEMIGTMPEDTNEDTRVAVLRNFNQMAIKIDGETRGFPVFVEQKEKDIHSYYNANLEGRNTMKIYVEIGNRATLTYGDGTQANFSLLGSRKAIAQANGRCRSHE